jgi:hypothetical protein
VRTPHWKNFCILTHRSLNVSLTIRNRGDSDSAEVAQFYLSDLRASTIVPFHYLIGFERVNLRVGESKTLKFTITPRMMSFYNEEVNWTAGNTAHEILKLFQDIVATEYITVLMSSDDPLVDKYAAEVVLLKDGQINVPIGS